jgi:Fe-Mn family superoxide dismutase
MRLNDDWRDSLTSLTSQITKAQAKRYRTSLLTMMMTTMMKTLLLLTTISKVAGSILKLADLPYEYDALEPTISADTLHYHYDKHHLKYVSTAIQLVKGTPLQDSPLEKIMATSYENDDKVLYNNAAQSWNHDFYWKSMTPKGGLEDYKTILTESMIIESFGTYENFRTEFSKAGNTCFGSGWVWLVLDMSTKRLLVTSTTGALNPMQVNPDWVPVLTMDVWEHAYYLDHQNMRTTYIDKWLESLANWEFVEENLAFTLAGRGRDEL